MRDTLSSGPDIIPATELGAVARRITFSSVATPGGCLAPGVSASRPRAVPAAAAPSSRRSSTADEPISVVLRVRPLAASERVEGPAAVVLDTERHGVVHVVPRNPSLHNAAIRANGRATFRFADVFDEQADQQKVFQETACPLVESLFHGTNGLLFAYGTSNAGKTYTIQGNKQAPGVLPRALDVIFNSIAAAKKSAIGDAVGVSEAVAKLVKDEQTVAPEADDDVFGVERVRDETTLDVSPEPEYRVSVSYLEIYNEQCFDLLVRQPGSATSSKPPPPADPTGEEAPLESRLKERYEPPKPPRPVKRKVLKLKENRTIGEVYAEGLKEVEVTSVDDVQRLLAFGQRNRSVAQTNVNEHSSRSHTIFCIKLSQRIPLAQKGRRGGSARITTSKLSIVDLAGNERTSRTGNTGERLKEASLINTSLMNLGHCLEAMRKNQRLAATIASSRAGNGKNEVKRPLGKVDMNANDRGNLGKGPGGTRRGNRLPPSKKGASHNPKMVPANGTGMKSEMVTVPFRQSRLTRLFQHQLETGSSVMIANVSPAVCDADETIHSLRRAAIAREVSTIAAPNKSHTIVPDTSRLVSPSMLREVERKYSTKATEDLRKIASLEAENSMLRSSVEEAEVEMAAERRQFEKEREELEGELDEVCRKLEQTQDLLALAESRFAVRECELREEIVRETTAVLERRDARHRQQLELQFAAGQEAAQARTNAVTATARKTMKGMTERHRKAIGERIARRVSMAVMPPLFGEDEEDDEDEWGEERVDQSPEQYESGEEDDCARALVLNDVEVDEEDYEFEDDYDEDGEAHAVDECGEMLNPGLCEGEDANLERRSLLDSEEHCEGEDDGGAVDCVASTPTDAIMSSNSADGGGSGQDSSHENNAALLSAQKELEEAESVADGWEGEMGMLQARILSERNEAARFDEDDSVRGGRMYPGTTLGPLFEEIDDAVRAGRLSERPVGPLGQYIRVKDIMWALRIEAAVSPSVCCSFLVATKEDRKVLRAILKKVSEECDPEDSAPCPAKVVIADLSEARSCVSDLCKTEECGTSDGSCAFLTVAGMLEVKHDAVWNYLMNVCRVDRIGLVKGDEEMKQLAEAGNVIQSAWDVSGRRATFTLRKGGEYGVVYRGLKKGERASRGNLIVSEEAAGYLRNVEDLEGKLAVRLGSFKMARRRVEEAKEAVAKLEA